MSRLNGSLIRKRAEARAGIRVKMQEPILLIKVPGACLVGSSLVRLIRGRFLT